MAADTKRVRFTASRPAVAALNTLARPLQRAGFWPRLNGDRLLARAQKRSGRDPALSPVFQEAFDARWRAYIRDARLSPLGVVAVREQFRHSLHTALEMSRAAAAMPEAAREKIERPVFILGLPRTGTTLLQRLLSCHAGARYLPFWEVYTPVPRDLAHPAADLAERKRAARLSLGVLHWLAPELMAIHPIEADDPEECYHLFRNAFLMPGGFDFAYLPSYWQWFEALPDKTALYRSFKLQLQILQHIDRRGHWVLKSPLHLAVLPELLEVFPDARIVYTDRDPAQSIASLASLVAVTWGMTSDRVDLHEVGRYVLAASARSEARARRRALTLGPDQKFEIAYTELVKDPIGHVLAISKSFGLAADPEFEARMRAWLAANPSTKHGRHDYDLATFGLDAEDVRRTMQEARETAEAMPAPTPRKAISSRS